MSRTDQQDRQHYEVLKREVAEIGFVRRGSVQQRWMKCGKPNCACMADPPRLHGPYYQWTRKVSGKTITVRLSQHKAKHFERWIANARQLDEIVTQMEEVSARATDRILHDLDNS